MTTLITLCTVAALIGFNTGYAIGWLLDPAGVWMQMARILLGAEPFEKSLLTWAYVAQQVERP